MKRTVKAKDTSIKTNIGLIKSKHEQLGQIFDLLEQFPYTEYMSLANVNGVYNTGRKLRMPCIYRIPFNLSQSKFYEWNDNTDIYDIPVNIKKSDIVKDESYIVISLDVGINAKGQIYGKLQRLAGSIRAKNEYYWFGRNPHDNVTPFRIIDRAMEANKGRKYGVTYSTTDMDWFKSVIGDMVTALYKDNTKLAMIAAHNMTVGKAISLL